MKAKEKISNLNRIKFNKGKTTRNICKYVTCNMTIFNKYTIVCKTVENIKNCVFGCECVETT